MDGNGDGHRWMGTAWREQGKTVCDGRRGPAKVDERQGKLTNTLSTSAHVSSSRRMSIGPTP